MTTNWRSLILKEHGYKQASFARRVGVTMSCINGTYNGYYAAQQPSLHCQCCGFQYTTRRFFPGSQLNSYQRKDQRPGFSDIQDQFTGPAAQQVVTNYIEMKLRQVCETPIYCAKNGES